MKIAITRAALLAATVALQKQGIYVPPGDKGLIQHSGVAASFKYDGETLDVEVLQHPFFLKETYIEHELQEWFAKNPAGIAIAAAAAANTENGFERFIDQVKTFFVKAEPVAEAVEAVAQEAEPILAFTPIGPEYNLAVNAIVGAQAVAKASLAAGTNLTNEQKFAIAVTSATPALDAILASKGITTDTQTHINNWIQTVFNILAGPVVKIVATLSGKTAAA